MGFPSETQGKRGVRVLHGNKELVEKVDRNDFCPCGSGKRFKKCCRNTGCFGRGESGPLLLGNEGEPARLGRAGQVSGSSKSLTRSEPPF
jgi:hypothetical protein